MRTFSLLFITITSFVLLVGQTARVSSAAEQIDASVLPLPEIMRSHATVLGYAPDMSLVTLRQGSNGMVCTASPPGSEEFDVRCYHQSFMPLLKRLRELDPTGVRGPESARIVDAEIRAKKLIIPDHPTAGYHMLGPISDYDPKTNKVGKRIISWQSIHVPYKTAAELGLPEEGQVSADMPYVMASGTFWCHIMIAHLVGGNPPS